MKTKAHWGLNILKSQKEKRQNRVLNLVISGPKAHLFFYYSIRGKVKFLHLGSSQPRCKGN